MRGDLPGGLVDIGQVSIAVTPPRTRCPHSDKHRLRLRHGCGQIGGEPQATLVGVFLHEHVKPGFVDGNNSLLQAGDFVGDLVDARHRVAEFGKTGAGDQANVAGPDHGNIHALTPCKVLAPNSAVPTRTMVAPSSMATG